MPASSLVSSRRSRSIYPAHELRPRDRIVLRFRVPQIFQKLECQNCEKTIKIHRAINIPPSSYHERIFFLLSAIFFFFFFLFSSLQSLLSESRDDHQRAIRNASFRNNLFRDNHFTNKHTATGSVTETIIYRQYANSYLLRHNPQQPISLCPLPCYRRCIRAGTNDEDARNDEVYNRNFRRRYLHRRPDLERSEVEKKSDDRSTVADYPCAGHGSGTSDRSIDRWSVSLPLFHLHQLESEFDLGRKCADRFVHDLARHTT